MKRSQKIRETMQQHADELTEISICGSRIGKKEPVFVVAEAACNHMCDMGLARKMIDKAVEAGADAIKFQTYKAEKLVTRNAVSFWGNEKISQLKYYRRLDRFGRKEYEELFKYSRDAGIIAFSTPFDEDSSAMLFELGMPVFKIASCDIPDLRLLRQIAGFGRPIILSTGASTVEEIDKAVETIFKAGNFQLMLLACTLSYPTANKHANLSRIRTLNELYPEITIGISDHTEPDPNMIIPTVAAAFGAKIIEKHYTLDRKMTGSGHFFAIDPSDLKKMVDNLRLVKQVQGNGKLGVAESEKKALFSARRSIVAGNAIPKGTIITSNMLGLKRPPEGLPASRIDEVIGKKAAIDIMNDQVLKLEMLE